MRFIPAVSGVQVPSPLPFLYYIFLHCGYIWAHSSVGRASALQAGGHRFEPYCAHQIRLVVQLVRMLACHARGRGFESHPGRHYFAGVAQLVEQLTCNQ